MGCEQGLSRMEGLGSERLQHPAWGKALEGSAALSMVLARALQKSVW